MISPHKQTYLLTKSPNPYQDNQT